MRLAFLLAFAASSGLPATAAAVELYGGGGTTGVELGIAQPLGRTVGLRVEGNVLSVRRDFTTDGIDYDARLKAANAGAYLDIFVGAGFRVTGGALIGRRTFEGTARSAAGTITFNGVLYPVTPGDSLDFEAKFPSVSPYLGLGWGHPPSQAGWGFYADAGVAYGRPKVTLSPSASLAATVGSANVLAEQRSAQEQADDYRWYPVVKLGIRFAF